MSTKTSTVHIDGWLYFGNAIGAGFLTYISTEEAYKYIDPLALFWMKASVGSIMAGMNALKAFRSMTFAKHNGNLQSTPSPIDSSEIQIS